MNERRLISTIKKVMPAVVSIVVTKKLQDLEKDIPPEVSSVMPLGPDGKRFHIPDELVDKNGMVQVGGGSGFIVESDGLIVTNKHVLSDPEAEYTVILDNGDKYPAEILARDPINDVAIIKIQAKRLPIVKLGETTNLQLGQSIIAIGNALGLFKNTVSLGIVSGLSRSISAQADPKAPPQEMRGMIQTDAAINPGNSGGPLVDLKGKAVGINSAVVFGAQNIGFAIPINAVKRDLHDYRKYGHIRRPLLGVRYITINENIQEKMALPVGYGALVTKETPMDQGIVPDSPADKAGLREKDIILECNSQRIDSDHAIQDILDSMNVGQEMEMKVLRRDKEFTVKIMLAERK